MAKRDKYHPDYRKLYPGVKISPEVMKTLKQSDRKMEYMEVDLKQGPFQRETAEFARCREDSLERLIDEEGMEFVSSGLSPEETAIRNDEKSRLRRALLMLEAEEFALIWALYFVGLSEAEYAKHMGVSQKTISNRWVKIAKKLKNQLKF